jgi:hypothetical protein
MTERAQPGQINYPLVDRFTVGHLAVGTMLGLIAAPWWLAVGTAITWELLEVPLKRTYPGLFPHRSIDTPINKVGDVAAMVAGWAAMRALPPAP